MSHSASKSSKNKKSKQKTKTKSESTDKESWRQEREPKLDSNAVNDTPAAEKSNDKSKEAEPTSSVESTVSQKEFDAPRSEKEEIVKSQNGKTGKVVVEETEEKHEEHSATEFKEVTSGSTEVNPADVCASEKNTSAVVFQQEPVVPLRSRGELKTSDT